MSDSFYVAVPGGAAGAAAEPFGALVAALGASEGRADFGRRCCHAANDYGRRSRASQQRNGTLPQMSWCGTRRERSDPVGTSLLDRLNLFGSFGVLDCTIFWKCITCINGVENGVRTLRSTAASYLSI